MYGANETELFTRVVISKRSTRLRRHCCDDISVKDECVQDVNVTVAVERISCWFSDVLGLWNSMHVIVWYITSRAGLSSVQVQVHMRLHHIRGTTTRQMWKLHGHRSRGDAGDKSPPEFGVGWTLMQIVTLRFCYVGTKRSVLWPSKYTKIHFQPELCPDPAEGAHDVPQTL